MSAANPETLARRRGRCHLCHCSIIAGEHYVSKLEPIGWVHARCAAGYRQVMAEHEEPETDRSEVAR